MIVSRSEKSKNAGFMMASAIAMVIMLAFATTMMMEYGQKANRSTNVVNARMQMTSIFTTLNAAIARNGELASGSIFLPPLPQSFSNFTDPGAGVVPASFGSQNDPNGAAIKYCVFYNGTNTPPNLGAGQVAPILVNALASSYYQIQNGPAYALIAPGKNGTVEVSCSSLTKTTGPTTEMKTAGELDSMLQNLNSDDKISAQTISTAISLGGEGAASLVSNLTACNWQTDKLVYNTVNGTAQFECVREQDQIVTVENNTGNGVGLFMGATREMHKGTDPSDPQNPVNILRFRNIAAGTNITLTPDANNNVVISSTAASTSMANQAVAGARVYIDGTNNPFRLRRIIGGGSVTVTETPDSIQINSNGGGGTVTGGTNIGGAPGLVFKQTNGSNLEFRTIRSADGNLQVSTVGDTIMLRNTMTPSANAINVGGRMAAGVPNNPADIAGTKSLYIGKTARGELAFRRLQAGPGVILSEGDGCANAAGGGIPAGDANNAPAENGNLLGGASNDSPIGSPGGSNLISANDAPVSEAFDFDNSGNRAVTGCEKSVKITLDTSGITLNEVDPVFTAWRNAVLPAPACSPSQVLRWDGSRFVCVSNGVTTESDPIFVAARPGAVCNGVNNKITWNGTQFTCEQDQAGGGGGGGGVGIVFINPVDVMNSVAGATIYNAPFTDWRAFNASPYIPAGARTVLVEVYTLRHNNNGAQIMLAREAGTVRTISLADSVTAAGGHTVVKYQAAVPVSATGIFEVQVPTNSGNPVGWGVGLKLIGYYNGGGGGGGGNITVAHSGSGVALSNDAGSTSTLTLKRVSGTGAISVTENAGGIVINSASDVTNAANVGAAQGQLFRDKVGGVLNFRTIEAGAGVTVTTSGDRVTISAGGGGGGQWTTVGSNIHYSTGSVGINTASPTRRLQVAGDIVAHTGDNAFSMLHSGNALIYSSTHPSGFRFGSMTNIAGGEGTYTGFSEKMRLDPSGNLVIGTTSNPVGSKLYVNGSTVTNGELSVRGSYFVARDASSGDANKIDINSAALRAFQGGAQKLIIQNSGYINSTANIDTTGSVNSNNARLYGNSGIAYLSNSGASQYAVAQESNGHTAINAPSGQSISFRINNVWPPVGAVDANGMTVRGTVLSGSGNFARMGDWAGDANYVMFGAGGLINNKYALLQNKTTGTTHLNGSPIYFTNDNGYSGQEMIYSGGRLGIGVMADATAKLHVNGTIRSDGGYNGLTLGSNSWSMHGGGDFILGRYVAANSYPSELFRITQAGNVGIGMVPDAAYKLDVNGMIRSTGGMIGQDMGSGTWRPTIRTVTSNDVWNDPGSGLSGFPTIPNETKFEVLHSETPGNPAPHMGMAVGYLISYAGVVTKHDGIFMTRFAGPAANTYVRGMRMFVDYNDNSSNMPFGLLMDPRSGDNGIGYSNVRFKIMRTVTPRNYNLGTNGNNVTLADLEARNMYADNFNNVSDGRLKTNIVNLESSVDKISALRGVTFQWKEDTDEAKAEGDERKTHVGLIAQEVEKIFPQLVNTDSKTGKKTVNYIGLIAPLIESVKTLKAENEMLKAKLLQQASLLESLESRVAALEQDRQKSPALIKASTK